MAIQTVQLSLQKSAFLWEDLPNSNWHNRTAYYLKLNPPAGKGEKLLLKFGAVPDEAKYKALVRAQVVAHFDRNTASNRPYFWASLARYGLDDFNVNTVSWNTVPLFADWESVGEATIFPPNSTEGAVSVPASYSTRDDAGKIAQRLATEVVYLRAILTSAAADTTIRFIDSGDNTCKLQLQYNDAIDVTSEIYTSAKTSGYLDPHSENTFSWDFRSASAEYFCAGTWTQRSATFHWKPAAASAWNSVPAGTAKQIVIPADTFPVGAIQWYVTGTDNQGTTTQTPVYTLSTAAALTTATPISPADTLVSSDSPVTFTWDTANANNPVQTGADVQYSPDGGSTWTQIGHADGDVRSLIVDPGAMSGGSVQWRVRSYNADGAAGPWSDPAAFYYIGAPAAPVVSATAVPFTTVTWTATGQQAYEVIIDGVSSGVQFGSGKSYTVKEPLLDGGHTIEVRVQGIYGLWSNPGEANITVQNQPGAAIALSGVFKLDAVLSWSVAVDAMPFLIYRDGKRIGRTNELSFRDRFVLGEHSYYILVDLGNGNYTRSNIVSGEMTADMTYIAAAEGGEWLPLRLSENSVSSQKFTFNRSHSLRHVTGAKYPVCEIAQFEDLSGSYDVAYKEADAAAPLEALFGHIVVIKSRGNSVIVGPLVTMNKVHLDMYLTYSFTVQQIEWEDFVDATNAGI